jgi:hypothetical protein
MMPSLIARAEASVPAEANVAVPSGESPEEGILADSGLATAVEEAREPQP